MESVSHSTTCELKDDVKVYVDATDAYRPVSEKKLHPLQKATSTDTQLQGVLSYIRAGWLRGCCKVFFQVREDHDGLLAF